MLLLALEDEVKLVLEELDSVEVAVGLEDVNLERKTARKLEIGGKITGKVGKEFLQVRRKDLRRLRWSIRMVRRRNA